MIFAANLKCNHTRASFQGYVSELDGFLKKENANGANPKNSRASGGAADIQNSATQGTNSQNSRASDGGVANAKNSQVNSKISSPSYKNSQENAQNLGTKDENSQADEILVFPPSTAFLQGDFAFTQGAQNFYPAAKGAFTGEIGSEHLAEFDIKCVLLGHSERRVLESDDLVQKKFDFAKANGYKIVLCVGENLDTKNGGKTKDFLSKRLMKLDLSYDKLIIAYEPIYSIGTGVSADPRDIAEILSFLASKSGAKCLYGGSVNESNIREILNLGHCSGVLIGSAALEAKKFINLINLIKKG